MPVTYAIQGNVLKMELVGKYLPDDIITRFVAAMNDPACPIPVAMIVDVSRSETLPSAPVPDIRRVAEALGPYAARIGGRCAVVASGDVHFGLSRLGSVYSGSVGVEVEVFRDTAEALAWLVVDPSR